MGKRIKYSKELLEPLVAESVSFAEVIRKLGLKQAGGTYSHICRVIKGFGIDTTHFTGSASNAGDRHKGGPDKLHWSEILVKRLCGTRQKAWRLRRALLECGREYKCCDCGIDTWNGKQLILQVDHLNRDWLDDTPQNLAFRCPNCHSQTEGWCGSGFEKELTSRKNWHRQYRLRKKHDRVAKSADALDLGSSPERGEGSTPSSVTL